MSCVNRVTWFTADLPCWLLWLRDSNYYCSSPDLWNFELTHAGIEEVAEPRFESRPDVECKLWEDGSPIPEIFLASGV